MIYTRNKIEIEYDPTMCMYRVSLDMTEELHEAPGKLPSGHTQVFRVSEKSLRPGGKVSFPLPDNILIGVKDDE